MSLADFVEKRVYVNGYMLLLVLRKAGHGIYNVPVKFSVDSEYLLTREYLFFDPFWYLSLLEFDWSLINDTRAMNVFENIHQTFRFKINVKLLVDSYHITRKV